MCISKFIKIFYLLLWCGVFLSINSCTTTITDSEGIVINKVIDKTKLAGIYTNLAIEYKNQRAFSVALEQLNLAVDLDKNYAKAYMVRAMIYEQLSRFDLARLNYKIATNLDYNDATILINYAVFLCERGDYIFADNLFKDGLNNSLYQTPQIGYLLRGNCNYLQQNFTQANADYLEALRFNNVPSGVYIGLAKVQYAQKNYKLSDYYFNLYKGDYTADVLLLRIQILDNLAITEINPDKKAYYNAQINQLSDKLINDFPNSKELQIYFNTRSNSYNDKYNQAS